MRYGIFQLYVIYMGEKQHDDPDLVTAIHHEALSTVLGRSFSKDAALESMVYSYRHGFSGFAARLTHAQAKQVAGLPGVLNVTPSRLVKATTTRSWDFLGLSLNNNPQSKLLHKAKMGEGIIVGVVDSVYADDGMVMMVLSGIWPESKSFGDEGFGPVPSRWKGTCQPGQLFNASSCNRKLIGARWYSKTIPPEQLKAEYLSPRDANDHGTHTASTIAGNVVRGANFQGLGAGRARGGAPRARLAVYKALWGAAPAEASGDDATVVKAIDDAIRDGVDVLSLSIGASPGSASSAHESWATLHAVQKGITVVYSAGNDGPAPESMEDHFPWTITVAASTTDRIFPTAITLGGNRTIVGQAIYWRTTKKGDNGFKELYYDTDDTSCNSPNATLVTGTIVICDTGDHDPNKQFSIAGENVIQAGGVGMIFVRYTTNLPVQCTDFPCAVVDLESRQQIIEHVIRTGDLRAKISLTRTALSDGFSPRVAAFSSRGPSAVVPSVLKPDVAAPGVGILAAAKDSYVFKDGTSMAAPHVSGVVALLKCLHPTWSPAAIKSAIVTTASTVDKYGLPILAEGVPRKYVDPFDYGGGNINPENAADPGLIYDINPKHYEEFKCMWIENSACRAAVLQPLYHLNLPSISIPYLKTSVTVSRSVTNVGASDSTYKVIVEPPPGINMEVVPSTLEFSAKTRVQTFKIKFTSVRRMQGVYTFGSLTWADGVHKVRIPIAVRAVIQELYANVQ
ncbi:hypothetical protein Taro_055419 [Colocasia esculenta]|uniref:Uncharacterized protein n=1 Tax=Colocasia esculenta TaxID=4460 RepID=A0A843XQY3_COLES|nr:hypothetical protein [Colocasia esculenta]